MRTAKKPLTYRDTQRMGGTLLTVSMFKTWWEYASHVAFDAKDFETYETIKAAIRPEDDAKGWTPVALSEQAANRLLDAVKRRGSRPNTALELDTAIQRAKRRPATPARQPKPKEDPEAKATAALRESFQAMFEAGELTDSEIEAGRKKGLI